MFTQKSLKSPFAFSCEKCDYHTSKKSDYNKHILTSKHQNTTKILTNTDTNATNVAGNVFTCECGKYYKFRQSLYHHKKTCKINDFFGTNEQSNETKLSNDPSDKELINETCKDAMNIMDFVDSIKLQLSDLEKVGEIGYVDGISNIITTNLKALDVTQRPIHCADRKRETLYIKDEDKWEKEDDEKNKLRKAIKRVACKNQRLIPKFKEAHPDCIKAASRFSDQYNKMIIESMGGSGDNDLEKEDKIIKKITKEVVIDKMNY